MGDRVITVIGLDGSPLSGLARTRLDAAALVMGGRRHLREVAVPAGTPTVALRDDPAEALRRVLDADGDAVVLASGDPGLFGVLRLLRERLPAEALEVLPAVSSVALAFARAGLSWDDAVVVSAHGRELRPAVAVCRAHPKVAVLTAPGAGPSELAAALVGTGRRLFVAERLGLDGERTTWTTPEACPGEWDDLNVVLVVDDIRAVAPVKGWIAGRPQPSQWALPDDAFAHRDGMLTKAEVRAVALARLGPRLGDLVWDIGAGSGSVGVECARLGAAVIAVEKGDTSFVEANAKAFDVDVRVVAGTAPAALQALPDPDLVFVGGGGRDVEQIVRDAVARGPRTVVVALAALDRLAGVQAALSPYVVDGVLLQASRLRDLAGATALAATNPVLLVWGNRT
ncbi:MAG: precorrin-6Y C5,15-methyltransferase [Frankiales bacterium]|nr:precorrin-6Y C5,15-methyltransferase [Frankiales bacterium]